MNAYFLRYIRIERNQSKCSVNTIEPRDELYFISTCTVTTSGKKFNAQFDFHFQIGVTVGPNIQLCAICYGIVSFAFQA